MENAFSKMEETCIKSLKLRSRSSGLYVCRSVCRLVPVVATRKGKKEKLLSWYGRKRNKGEGSKHVVGFYVLGN